MSAQDFGPDKLTQNEQALLTTFHCRCVVEGITEFSSDTFRKYELDRALYGDPIHAIGLLFCKAKHFRLIEEIGRKRSEIPSNHGREIRRYKWKEK